MTAIGDGKRLAVVGDGDGQRVGFTMVDDIPDLSFFADNAGIDTYEVLKGPQALLYGSNPSLFGLVIKTTKKPRPQFEANFGASVGDYGWRRADLDITGPLANRGLPFDYGAMPLVAQVTAAPYVLGVRAGFAGEDLAGFLAEAIGTPAQRLARKGTLYLFDEPTTGLHFEDVKKLLEVLHELADQGNTVVVIEHNLDVVKTADWVIDLGPEGGDGGGEILATGTPEAICSVERSHTGRFLAPLLARQH